MTREELQRIFTRIPTLETERLQLRAMSVKDASDMYDYARRFDVTRYLLWEPHGDRTYTEHYLSYLERLYRVGEFYDWALVDRKSGHMIGTCGFTRIDLFNRSAEIGYVLNPAYWGRGLACEAVRAVLEFGFCRLSLHRIDAHFMVDNEQSRRVAEKCGMHFEGVMHGALFVRGEYVDVGVCALLSDEYFGHSSI